MTTSLSPDTTVCKAVDGRSNIFEMTQAAEDAVLRPKDFGCWSRALRAGLAARIALLNNETELSEHFRKDAGEHTALADPAFVCPESGLKEVLCFMDKVAADTRDVTNADIKALQSAGITDADIVRLAELNAFLAYQIRLIAGLRLMNGGMQ
ncbi:hypothetical protein [Roseobacter sp.]|uniref:hypothetical protein n=1 Tax=Roseobacter sp. TaxID=1907202 RepID=UPI00385BB7E6